MLVEHSTSFGGTKPTVRDEEADQFWHYLDSNPEAIYEMIKILADSHPNLN
jgi:hypothetical protein